MHPLACHEKEAFCLLSKVHHNEHVQLTKYCCYIWSHPCDPSHLGGVASDMELVDWYLEGNEADMETIDEVSEKRLLVEKVI